MRGAGEEGTGEKDAGVKGARDRRWERNVGVCERDRREGCRGAEEGQERVVLESRI